MKFSLRIESPVHVGTGEQLSWLDYVLTGRQIHVIDWRRILEAASASHDDVAEKLAGFTDVAALAIEEAQRNMTKAAGRDRSDLLRKLRDQTSAVRFAREDLHDDGLARAIGAGEFDRYQAEFFGGRLDRRLEIREQMKAADGTPVIPASTVRGQIRTALMHNALSAIDDALVAEVLEGGGDVDGWNRGLADATPGRARFLFGDELEQAVFRVPAPIQRRRRNEPALDLLRFLTISEPVRARTALVVLRASPFQLSRARERDGGVSSTPLAPLVLEAIDEGSELEYDLRVETRLLRGVAAAEGDGHALLHDRFWSLFHRVFGITRAETAALDDAALEARVLSAVEVSLAAHMTALIRRETLWCEQVGVPKDAGPRAFFADLDQRAKGRLPMRLGWGSGLHSITAIPALEHDAALAAPLGRALARAGLGLSPRERRERAEREKTTIERARRESSGSGGPRLREELQNETRDPHTLPKSRRFTMAGGSPDVLLGFTSLARGPLTEQAIAPARRRDRLGAAEREPEHQRERPRERRGREPERREPERRDADRRDRSPAPSSRDQDRRERRPAERRPPVPDRPANQSEIEDLLRKFGPRR